MATASSSVLRVLVAFVLPALLSTNGLMAWTTTDSLTWLNVMAVAAASSDFLPISQIFKYWIVLSLALLLELLLDQAPILKKSKALYIAYQAVKLAFVLWCLAPFDLNGAEVTFTGLILPALEASTEAASWTKLVVADMVERASVLPNVILEILVDLSGLFHDLLSYLETFYGDILAGLGSFFEDILQSLYENARALGQLVVEHALYLAQLTSSFLLSSLDLFLSLVDLLLTPVKDLAFLFVSLFEYLKELFSFVPSVGEYVAEMFYVLKEYFGDLFSFTFDILSYIQEPFGNVVTAWKDIANSLQLTFTSDFVSYVRQPLSHVVTVFVNVRSIFAQLPMLFKELISYVLLALAYLRQLIADLPVMLLKWEEVEDEGEKVMFNSFKVWGREEVKKPRLISEALRRWWRTTG